MKKFISLYPGQGVLESAINKLFAEAANIGGFSGLYDFGSGYTDHSQSSVQSCIELANIVIERNGRLEARNEWSIADGRRSGFDLILNNVKIASVVDGKITFTSNDKAKI